MIEPVTKEALTMLLTMLVITTFACHVANRVVVFERGTVLSHFVFPSTIQ